jgi:hypothetical protein
MDLSGLFSWIQPFINSFVQWLQQLLTAILGGLGG